MYCWTYFTFLWEIKNNLGKQSKCHRHVCDCQSHIISQKCQSIYPFTLANHAFYGILSVSSLFVCFSDPFKPFIIFSNRHEIRRIDLHKGEFSVLVPGLRNTIALDFHLNESSLYWTDVVEDKIYRGKLSENGGKLTRALFKLVVTNIHKNAVQFIYTVVWIPEHVSGVER